MIHVVVVDFGLSEVFSSPAARSKVISGTPPYMAPEVWSGNSGKACDVWSCGVMLFYMLSGRFPFHCQSPEEFAQATATYEPDFSLMGGASKHAHALCKQMLLKSDVFRPSARQAMKNPWFLKFGAQHSDIGSSLSLSASELQSLKSLPRRTEFEKFVNRLVATQTDASKQTRVNDFFRMLDV